MFLLIGFILFLATRENKNLKRLPLLIMGIVFFSLWIFLDNETFKTTELTNIKGTLASDPLYHSSAKTSASITFYLTEYENRGFHFYVNTYSINSLNKSNFLDRVKGGDMVVLSILKTEHKEKIMDSSYPRFWQRINTYIKVLGIESDGVIYTSVRDFNIESSRDKQYGNILFPLIGIILIGLYFYAKKRDESK